MRRKRRLIAGSLTAGTLSVGLVMGGALGASAQSVGGGTWTYGTTSVSAWSHYYHASKNHTATACNGMGICVRGTAGRAATADGTVGKVPFSGGTTAYWSVIN